MRAICRRYACVRLYGQATERGQAAAATMGAAATMVAADATRLHDVSGRACFPPLDTPLLLDTVYTPRGACSVPAVCLTPEESRAQRVCLASLV